MANTPFITPADLYRNQVYNRQQGTLTDPYGLSTAIGSLGAGYAGLNSELTSGAHAFDTVSRSLANEAAGLPAANAARDLAGARLGTERDTNALRTRQTIEEAFQAAIAKGYKPGTRAFNDYMVSHVNTYDAASRITPEVAKGNLQAQSQEVQAKAMKAAIDKYIRQQVINKYVSENKDAAIQAADINGIPRQQAVQQMLQYATKLGDAAVEHVGAQVVVDPDTGLIKAMDISGKPFEIPPAVLAAGYAMGGNKTPFGVLENLTKDQLAAVRQSNLNDRTAGLLQHYDTEAQKALSPNAGKAPPKPVLDPLIKERINHFLKVRADYVKALGVAGKTDGTAVPVPKELKEEYEKEKAWWESLHTPQTPSSAVITGADAAGSASAANAPESYDYGVDYGATYDTSGGPEAMPTFPKSASGPLAPYLNDPFRLGLTFDEAQ